MQCFFILLIILLIVPVSKGIDGNFLKLSNFLFKKRIMVRWDNKQWLNYNNSFAWALPESIFHFSISSSLLIKIKNRVNKKFFEKNKRKPRGKFINQIVFSKFTQKQKYQINKDKKWLPNKRSLSKSFSHQIQIFLSARRTISFANCYHFVTFFTFLLELVYMKILLFLLV